MFSLSAILIFQVNIPARRGEGASYSIFIFGPILPPTTHLTLLGTTFLQDLDLKKTLACFKNSA